MRYDLDMVADFPIRMEGDYGDAQVVLVAARIEEGFNSPASLQIEFASTDQKLDLNDFVGKQIKVICKVPDGASRLEKASTERTFVGTCVAAEYVGSFEGAAHYAAEIRPRLWFLSLARDCRIFQEKTAKDIITDVLGEHGFDIDDKLTGSYPTRVICVQYRESDLDFIHRLMEEEGIHYFLTHGDGIDKIVLADSAGAYQDAPREPEIAFRDVSDRSRHGIEHFYEFESGAAATTGKVTLNDYNFETPKAVLKTTKTLAKGTHAYKDYEIYDYPGHYQVAADGERYARIKVEERAFRHKELTGTGLVSNLEPGRKFKVTDHQRIGSSEEFVVSKSTHYLRLNKETLDEIGVPKVRDKALLFSEDSDDPYQVAIKAFPSQEVFRPEFVTPWPEIAGIQTAVVTGKQGEEIWTDKYGRVRIQFHWDRLGAKNETSTCWVRCMMPWVGSGFGAHFWPRMGQEVVVQFEEGSPDRPVIVGMFYNADNMPPYALPENQTKSGVKTRSSKQGNANTFNELRFEDKKGSEEVYFHAEKNYNQVVENDATITVGFDKKDKGDLTQKIYHDKTEEVGNDLKVKVGYGDGGKSPGDMKHEVYNDRTETIGNNFKVNVQKGNHDTTVEKGNQTNTVDTGNQSNKVSKGNMTNEVSMGNFTETIKMGNHTTKVNLGKTEHEAMQSIEFKVGANSIKIDQSGVTIKGIMVKIEAQAMAQTNAPMVKINGSGMVMIQGALVKIN